MEIRIEDLSNINKKGVYLILNKINRKFYIGSTIVSFKARFTQHSSLLNRGEHANEYLQNSYNKYGKDSFIFYILYINDNDNLIREKEQEYIIKYDACNREFGYNLDINVYRSKRSESTKLKMSNSKKGKYKGKENPFYGKTHTPEVREKIRQAHLGVKLSEDTKKKMAEKRNIKVKINNVIYPSIKEAALQLEMSEATLSRWIKDKRKVNYETYSPKI